MENKNAEKVYSNEWTDYKFPDDVVVGEFKITKSVSANQIESVIVNAFEGGSNYWMGLNNSTEIWNKRPNGIPLSTWATQMLLEGETIEFYDIEDESEKWSLTLPQLINGIKLNHELRTWDNSIEDGDAGTADCILQYALFGKIVFG